MDVDSFKALLANVDLWRRDRALGAIGAPSEYQINKFSPTHRLCIALHLNGFALNEIASTVRRPASWVLQTLNDPVSKRIIATVYDSVDAEVSALLCRAVEAVRDALSSEDTKVRLQAADMVFKSNGKYRPMIGTEGISAEDVVQRALAIAEKAVGGVREVRPSRPFLLDSRSDEIIDVLPAGADPAGAEEGARMGTAAGVDVRSPQTQVNGAARGRQEEGEGNGP